MGTKTIGSEEEILGLSHGLRLAESCVPLENSPVGSTPSVPAAPLGQADMPWHEFVSVDELAAELQLNRKTLYNAIRQRQVPGVRAVGNRIIVHRPTVVDWFRNGRGAVPRSRSKP